MKSFFISVFLFLASLATAVSVKADGSTGLPAVTFDPPKAGGGTLQSIVSNILSATLGLVGVVALVAFIYAGILWMISAGDASKIAKAKKTMIWAVAGMVIIFAAFSILTLIFNALGYPTPGAKVK